VKAFVVAVMGAVALAITPAHGAAQSDVQQELVQSERDWCRAMVE
jgi:hypothetical protein